MSHRYLGRLNAVVELGSLPQVEGMV
jgi:hypothetical protein